MICPTCNGEGWESVLFPKDVNVCSIVCTRCKGTKEVDDNTPTWKVQGKILKDSRMSKRFTLRKACKQLDLDPIFLSNMEQGIIAPDMNLYKELKEKYNA